MVRRPYPPFPCTVEAMPRAESDRPEAQQLRQAGVTDLQTAAIWF